jgi:hypothetical protein
VRFWLKLVKRLETPDEQRRLLRAALAGAADEREAAQLRDRLEKL